MSATNGFRTRAPVKQNQILSQLRREIVEGKRLPGAQLPTRKELERTFQVSGVTLQRALDRLMRDGFVYAKGSMGTFVSERLPFVCNYGLVFSSHYARGKWNRFRMALKNEAERLSFDAEEDPGSGEASLSIYYADDCHANSTEYQRLLRHIRDHRLAGLIFVAPLDQYHGTPLLEASGLARVSICETPVDLVPSRISLEGLMERALDYLAERGRKRVALVSSSHMTSAPEKMRQWTEGIRARGMITQPHWQQGLDIENPQSARNLVHLLMHDGQHQRPDGLLIGDDNLVEHATAGLIDAGVNVPGDVEVVAHCNFPWPTPSVLPVKRLGYDVRECLRTCVTLIDRQRKSQPVPAAVTVPARFEEDVVANGWAEDGGDGIKD